MFNPADVLDRDLYYKTPLINKMIKQYIDTYGKDCMFYINPNNEGSENGTKTVLDESVLSTIANVNDSHKRIDNYSLAYGKDLVGFDFNKLQKVNARVLAEYKDYYVHDVGAEDNVTFYLQVIGTPVSRGDIISYNIQDKVVFYRITDKVQSYMEIVYRIQCKLIQVKILNGKKRPYDILEPEADAHRLPKEGIVL